MLKVLKARVNEQSNPCIYASWKDNLLYHPTLCTVESIRAKDESSKQTKWIHRLVRVFTFCKYTVNMFYFCG